MSTVPAAPPGLVATMAVSEITVKLAAVVPNFTPVAPVNVLPIIVTASPPAALPLVAVTAVTLGNEAALYVNWSPVPVADVPANVVTRTSTVPAASGGDVVVIDVADTTVKLAATVPKLTDVAPVKFVPVIVRSVPPPVVPLVVLRLVTVG